MRRWRENAREGLNDFLCLVSRPAIGQALCVPWGVTACYVHTILDIFCAGTRTIPDRASVHTHQRGFRREVAPGQSRRWGVGISNSLCVRLWCGVKQVFRPSRKWISRKEDWSPLKRKQIFLSKEWNYFTKPSPWTAPARCSMCMNHLFQFCARRCWVFILYCTSRHERLSSIGWTLPKSA